MSTVIATVLMLAIMFGLPATGIDTGWTAALAAWGGYLTCLLQAWIIYRRDGGDG